MEPTLVLGSHPYLDEASQVALELHAVVLGGGLEGLAVLGGEGGGRRREAATVQEGPPAACLLDTHTHSYTAVRTSSCKDKNSESDRRACCVV